MAQVIFTSFFLLLTLLLGAGGALCAGGNIDSHCGNGCQSQLGGGGRVGDVGSIITREIFEEMVKYRNYTGCEAKGFYTYDAFISAANAFPDFGIAGDDETRKREIAAFFGQTSFETTGASAGASEPYAWGYCYVNSTIPSDACADSTRYPCVPGKQYYGRGLMQLTWNYNYGPCGQTIGEDLLHNPDIVATDGVISFKSAIWFWMTAQSPKPSCHDVLTGRWLPSDRDISLGRVPGYGLTTNIINGGYECGQGENDNVKNRIGYYKRYCDILGIGYGENLDCYNQTPYGNDGLVELVNSM